MTYEEFHRRLLSLLRQADRADLCSSCLVLELTNAAQAVVSWAGLDSLDLALHGVPQQLFDPAEEPQHHHLH